MANVATVASVASVAAVVAKLIFFLGNMMTD